MTKMTKEAQREFAFALYMQGMGQQEIAEKVGVTRQTINKWINDNGWSERRAAKTVSRGEIVKKMLQQLDDKIESDDWTADEVCKAATAIEKIDRQTNIVTVIEVFSVYNQWLVNRMNLDPELTPELVKVMNRYQDLFISEKLNNLTLTEEN